MKTYILLGLAILMGSVSLQAQHIVSEELQETFMKKDSLLFDEGFNKCNLKVLETQLTEDLEFYHDLGGPSDKQGFLDSMAQNICGNPNQEYRRELIEDSVDLFPLYNNGVLYGMIQHGKHEFFAKDKESTEFEKTGSALFSSLWILQDGQWLLKRAYSYHHGPN